MAELQARWHQATAELPEDQWQSLRPQGPFYSWRWLHHLESSGSITPRQGWQCCHLSLWRADRLVAIAPLYLKGHSYGEFVFDQSFAQLAGQLGLRYYPKLVGMSPVSPIQGYRFLIDAGEDAGQITLLMVELIIDFCRRNRILSCNFLYVDPVWQPLAEAAGAALWLNQQSLWTNPGHDDFDGYLKSFNANQRRNIRRERQSVARAGLTVSPLVGDGIPPELLGRMHHFYAQHCSRWGPWGSKYLSESFFAAAATDLRHHLVLFSAHDGDPLQPLAMSLCVADGENLWGRYWGSDVEVDNLHFEVCYYAPIDWAIQRGIRCFDPGAGGSHKRRRGFVAEPRASLHLWQDPEFDAILSQWLPGANRQMLAEIEAVNAELPFSASTPPPMPPNDPPSQSTDERVHLDEQLSQRSIDLDPCGYFLIKLDSEAGELIAEHYSNGIDERGLATDPDTGEVLSCRGGGPRTPLAIYRGRSAKQLGIILTEGDPPLPVTRVDHALYLGRELQKAETCLAQGINYVQD